MIFMPDLFSFAYVPNWYSQLDMLAEMALPEPWRFKNPIERGFTVFINGIEHFFVSVIKVLTQLFNVIVPHDVPHSCCIMIQQHIYFRQKSTTAFRTFDCV